MVQKLLQFILYSNLFIGLCTLSLTLLTQYWYGTLGKDNVYASFVFFATVVLYGAHRLVGLGKVLHKEGRFLVVEHLREGIFIVTMVCGLGSVLTIVQLSWDEIKELIIPVCIAAAYVLPVFPGRKRLRDLSYIKLFALAAVYTWLTFFIPMKEAVDFNYLDGGLMLERFLFIMAITLPFDIRDIEVDRTAGVQTLATQMGEAGTRKLAQIILFAGFLCLMSVSLEHGKFFINALACIPGYLMAYIFILGTRKDRPDTYYLLGLDGTMVVLFLGNYAYHLWFA